MTQLLPLYTFATPSHEWMADHWLRPSLPSGEFSLQQRSGSQLCPTGAFHKPGWRKTVLAKVGEWLAACRESEVFVFADTDIQFFAPARELLLRCLGDNDIAFSQQHPSGYVNTGLFICRATPETVRAFEWVYNMLSSERFPGDNSATAHYLAHESHRLQFTTLPYDRFWTPHHKYKSLAELDVPVSTMVAHHATYAEGGVDKRRQLEHVATAAGVVRDIMAHPHPQIISFYTRNTWYEDRAKLLIGDCVRLGLDYRIEGLDDTGHRMKNILQRGTYVHNTLESSKRPVLWIDVDHRLIRQPDLLRGAEVDFASRGNGVDPKLSDFQRRQIEEQYPADKQLHGAFGVASGTMFFNYTAAGRELAVDYARRCEDASVRPPSELGAHEDEKLLFRLLCEHDDRTRILWLPQEYWDGDGTAELLDTAVVVIGHSTKLCPEPADVPCQTCAPFVREWAAHIKPKWSLEWGGGDGLAPLVNANPQAAQVVSVVHDKQHAQRLQRRYRARHKVVVVHEPIPPDGLSYYAHHPIKRDPDRRYDLIVVSGRRRSECLIAAAQLVSERGVVILTDCRREPYAAALRLFNVVDQRDGCAALRPKSDLMELINEPSTGPKCVAKDLT